MADSDSPAENDDDDELELDDELRRMEEMLGKMRPSKPSATFSSRLEARLAGLAGLAGERRRKSRRSGAFLLGNHPALSAAERRRRRWARAVPLGIAALVTLSGVVLLHRLANLPPAAPVSAYPSVVDATSSEAPAGSADLPFVEVSSERSLREVEAEDIVVVDGVGPMRPVLLHYEAAQCWVDPDTQTSVQVIVPWQEMVFLSGIYLLTNTPTIIHNEILPTVPVLFPGGFTLYRSVRFVVRSAGG